jgi:hypothetical protein
MGECTRQFLLDPEELRSVDVVLPAKDNGPSVCARPPTQTNRWPNSWLTRVWSCRVFRKRSKMWFLRMTSENHKSLVFKIRNLRTDKLEQGEPMFKNPGSVPSGTLAKLSIMSVENRRDYLRKPLSMQNSGF